MQLQTTSPESKFPNEHSDVIFVQIDQHLKKLLQKYKGVPIFWITVYIRRNKKAVLTPGSCVMLQLFLSVQVRQQHSLQV